MIFEFYWVWYEDYNPILLEGPDKTEEEFKDDCIKAMEETFDDYMEQERGWASLPNWIEKASRKLEDYGYKIFSPVKWGYFGLFLPKEEDLEDDKDYEDIEELSEQIKKMRKHNSDFEKKMDEEREEKADK